MWPLVSGIGPRLCVTVFTFCQPFLINATVNFMATTTTTPESKKYGQALVGGYALVYLGLTVRFHQFEFPKLSHSEIFKGINGGLLASNISSRYNDASRPCINDLSTNESS